MNEMHMQPSAIVWPLGSKNGCLTKAANTVAVHVMAKIAQKAFKGFAKSGAFAAGPKRPQNPYRFFMQIFRQVRNRSLDFIMDRMAFLVGRTPHGDQFQLQPRFLQPKQFLCNERLRKPRISLQKDDDFFLVAQALTISFFSEGYRLLCCVQKRLACRLGGVDVFAGMQPFCYSARNVLQTIEL